MLNQKDAPLKGQGYLLKWVNMWQGWQKRFFVIKDSFLIYKEAPDAKTKGTINLQDADVRMSANDALKISIKCRGNGLKLRAGSISEKVQWIDWFRQAQVAIKKGLPEGDRVNNMKEPEPFSILDSKNQELSMILQKRFHQGNTEVTTKLSKIYSIQSCMEDTLASFVSEVQALAGNEKIKSLADSLETLSNELKTVTLDALRCANQKTVPNKIEETKEDDIFESSSSGGTISDEEFDTANEEEISKNTSGSEDAEYRLSLPAKRSNLAKVSVWQVLKDMIGKDLTHFSVPIYFMEPITMLQKVAECLEYEGCLRKAATCPDPLLRMSYVVAFLVAQYAATLNRTKKPFNPILGETFEYVAHNYKFFSEQVSHHPPISACHCHSDSYEFWMHTNMKFAFWGKSLEGTPLGSLNVYLKKFNERYVLSRPMSACCNIIIGKMYIDNYGDATAVNQKTGDKAKVHFSKCGWFSKNYGSVNGTIADSSGTTVYEIHGNWTESLILKKAVTGEEIPIWRRNEYPPEWENYYYFPEFTYQLNNLTERLKKVLPPTDSRFRPDQRALENGDLKLSQTEKVRLEEKQRAARKEREKDKTEYRPAYFVETVDDITHEKTYMFNWKYWQDREQHNWKHLPSLF